MQLVPGAVMAGEQNSAAGSPQRSISFNVNGVSRLQNNTKLDGASIVYPWLPTNTAYVPSAEAIEEVSIVTNSYNAEQGLAGGAAINVVIKSGTNSFRGTAWGYNTDYDWRARNFFLSATTPKPDGYLNQFGGNLGGPIVKNKLFFFANWERTKREQIAPVRQFSLATRRAAPRRLQRHRRDDLRSGVAIPIRRCARRSRATSSRQNRIDPAALEMMQPPASPNGAGLRQQLPGAGHGRLQARQQRLQGQLPPEQPAVAVRPLQLFAVAHLRSARAGRGGRRRAGRRPARHRAGQDARRRLRRRPTPSARRCCSTRNFGYTRQKLGAEGPGHRHQLRPRRAAHPRHQRPRSAAGRHALVPGQRLGQHGQPEHGQSRSSSTTSSTSRP